MSGNFYKSNIKYGNLWVGKKKIYVYEQDQDENKAKCLSDASYFIF